ncbi:MAG TPA: lectin, partial [Pseudoxanthomonas sp.]|nr:lectin [Pseudoxanthomonas sp.]
VPCAVLMVMAVAGCSRDASPTAAEVVQDPTVDSAAGVAFPEPAEVATPADPAQAARFEGYGDIKLGSTAAEARQAWGGDLEGSVSEPGACHYLFPAWAKSSGELGFMIEGGRFVRYDVGSDKETAPGGGKVGMTGDEIRALYGDVVQAGPHKYVEGAQYLSIAAGGEGAAKLVFETDASGSVTVWRVGLPPQVDYVEGCS